MHIEQLSHVKNLGLFIGFEVRNRVACIREN